MDPQTELLNQLKDIDLPANSGWPIAPGWILLAVLLLLAVVLALMWWRRRSAIEELESDWRTPALAELHQIEVRFQQGDAAAMADCSRLVRRVTLARAKRTEVAALNGQAWLQKLDELSSTDFFTQGHGQLLATAPYSKSTTVEPAQLEQIVAATKQLIELADSSRQRGSA